MANTRAQLSVENWIRSVWMPERYEQRFLRKRLSLSSGGLFEFDAVSADGKIIANISTSGSRTANGKQAVGKMNKIRSDIYFLLLADAERKVELLTESDMYEQWRKEVENGRVPDSIEFTHVRIPAELNMELQASRRRASRESGPR